jgi:hypothetical protein
MSSIFAITITTNSIRLSDNRPGEVVFTVSNTSNRPVRGRARLVLPANAPADWFTIVGAAERDFAPAATQQYTVQANPAATEAGGRYLLRLDMIGVQNPDEEFAEGPTVTVEVAPAQPMTKPFPWWIVAAGLGGLLVLAVLAFVVIRLVGGNDEPPTTEPITVQPITDPAEIMAVMKIEELATDQPIYIAGDRMTTTYLLVNRADRPVQPDGNNSPNQASVGVCDHLLERLSNNPDIPFLTGQGIKRVGDRFSISSRDILVEEELASGDQIAFSEQMSTAFFPAGDYRIIVQCRDLDGNLAQAAAVGFEVR